MGRNILLKKSKESKFTNTMTVSGMAKRNARIARYKRKANKRRLSKERRERENGGKSGLCCVSKPVPQAGQAPPPHSAAPRRGSVATVATFTSSVFAPPRMKM